MAGTFGVSRPLRAPELCLLEGDRTGDDGLCKSVTVSAIVFSERPDILEVRGAAWAV